MSQELTMERELKTLSPKEIHEVRSGESLELQPRMDQKHQQSLNIYKN